jgi:hypothetical protein
MKINSRLVIHTGINFVTIPMPIISSSTYLSFQQAIISDGLEFVRAENPQNSIILTRETPSILQITVNTLESQIGQLLIVSPQPKGSLDLFIQESEAAIHAFETVWPAQNRQIIKADATIRELYETTYPHAFKELWENRLGQSSQALAPFGRPIRGGGLRFVMEPISEDMPMPVQIEVKIESYLLDTNKIFVETQFAWPMPTNPGAQFEVRERLTKMNTYIQNQVSSFMTGATNDSK